MEEVKEEDKEWNIHSWEKYPIRHQPEYPNKEKLKATINTISTFPNIVQAKQIEQLKSNLKEWGEGKRMLIHIGDCSESFDDWNKISITRRYSLITLAQLILQKLLSMPIVKIGRIAGQYAKPRSTPTEDINGVKINSFYGDNVNKFDPVLEDRIPDPQRLIEGHQWSVITYQTIRRLEKKDNIDDIMKEVMDSQIKMWDKLDKEDEDFEDFMITLQSIYPISWDIDNLYISHEGLLLNYESALTKSTNLNDEQKDKFYNLSTHYLWIGERTNKLNEAHLEYFRGISNPVGIKWGPATAPQDFIKVLQFLNPENEMGRIVLITRFGASKVETVLPPLIEEITKNEINVVWVCDAVHGNTYTNEHKIKVRDVDAIYQELIMTHKILLESKQNFGGIHLETSADYVTEWIGGLTKITDPRLKYTSKCDPRLNFVQTLHILYKFWKNVESYKKAE